jgi:hypothetical protein
MTVVRAEATRAEGIHAGIGWRERNVPDRVID